MKKVVITESEKSQILSKHLKEISLDLNNIVITDWLSPDEKYAIFLDELYDLENKTKLGDIWKSPDNLILFLEHSFRVSKLRRDIKEHAAKTFDKLILTENVGDLTDYKLYIKHYLKEGFWDDTWVGKGLGYAGKFIKDTAVDTVSGVYNFGKDLVVGGAKLGGKILTGQWKEVWDLLKQGTKWLARKIRQAAYSPVGIIIDTILVATGVGKIAQAVVWAIIVSLDIYEFVTGDYENKDDPMWMRVVFFLIDIMGLVFAGLAAKGARTALQTAIRAGGAEIAGLERAVAKNPTLKATIIKMIEGLKSLPSKLASWGTTLSKSSFGKLFKMALDKVGSFIKWITQTLVSSWKTPELRSILKTTGLVVGIGTGTEALKDYSKKKGEEQKAELKKKEEEEGRKEEELVMKALANKNLDYSSLL
jgi:hypothetical protein